MAQINFRPEIIAQPATNVPTIRIKQSRAEAQAWNEIADTMKLGLESYGEYKKKQYAEQAAVDTIDVETKAAEIRLRMADELEHMPVEGVNAELERERIITNAKNDLKSYVKDNARNLDVKEINRHYQMKTKQFESAVNTEAVKHEIDYGHKANRSKFEKNDAFIFDQLNKATETGTRKTLRDQLAASFQMQQQMGYLTPDQAKAKLNTVDSSIRKQEIDVIQTDVSNAVYAGDYELAEQRLNDLDPYMNETQKKEFKNRQFGSATYNAFNNRINALDTIDEIQAFKEDVKQDQYMSEDKHKSILEIRADKAIARIVKDQMKNTKTFIDSAEDGELNLEAWDKTEGLEGRNAVYGNREQVERILLKTQKLHEAEELIEADKKEYKAAIKSTDAGGISDVRKAHEDLLEFQLKGNIELNEVQELLKDYKKMHEKGNVSTAIHRQLEREAIKAYRMSLEDNQMKRDVSWFFGGVKELSENEIKIYQSVSEKLREQNESVGEFINLTDTFNSTVEAVDEWIKLNPDADRKEVNDFIKEVTEPIRLNTIKETMFR